MRESFESSELSVSSRSLGYLDHPDCQYYQPRPYFFRLGQEFLRGPGRHGRIILFYIRSSGRIGHFSAFDRVAEIVGMRTFHSLGERSKKL